MFFFFGCHHVRVVVHITDLAEHSQHSGTLVFLVVQVNGKKVRLCIGKLPAGAGPFTVSCFVGRIFLRWTLRHILVPRFHRHSCHVFMRTRPFLYTDLQRTS